MSASFCEQSRDIATGTNYDVMHKICTAMIVWCLWWLKIRWDKNKHENIVDILQDMQAESSQCFHICSLLPTRVQSGSQHHFCLFTLQASKRGRQDNLFRTFAALGLNKIKECKCMWAQGRDKAFGDKATGTHYDVIHTIRTMIIDILVLNM